MFGTREVWSSVLMARVNGDRSGAGVGHAVAERVPGRRPCRPATSRVAGCHGPCFTKAKGHATLRSYPQESSFVNALAGSYWLPGDQEPCVLPCSGRGVSPARQHHAGFIEAHSRKVNEASRGGPTDDRPASPTKASRGRRSSSVAPCRMSAVPNKALHLTSGAGNRTPLAGERRCSADIEDEFDAGRPGVMRVRR